MRKAVLIFSLLCLLISFGLQARVVSIEEATQLVKNLYPEESNLIYEMRDSLENDGFWNFFVDPSPLKGWEHECYKVRVTKMSTDGGDSQLSIEQRMTPPACNIVLLNPPRNSVHRASASTIDVKPRQLFPEDLDRAKKTHAIIISGGMNKNANRIRYWNDCSLIYKILTRKYGVPKNNIYPLISDGKDPGIDMRIGEGEFDYISSPLDLDGDGTVDTYGAAKKEDILRALNIARSNMSPGDQLYLFVTDHGGLDKSINMSYIWLWEEDRLYASELRNYLNQFYDSEIAVNVVMGQCYSGGFIEWLNGKNAVISTACKKDEVSSSFPTGGQFDKFIYYWCYTHLSSVDFPDGHESVFFGDKNSDGRVSMRESFEYALFEQPTGENPQYSSTPSYFGSSLFLDGSPLLNNDLVVRDTNVNPNSPLLPTDVFWESPDICINGDPYNTIDHTNVYYNSSTTYAFVHLKVRNNGLLTYKKGQYYHVYWAKSAANIDSRTWMGYRNQYDVALGGHIGSGEIPSDIAPGDSCSIIIQWNIPELLRTSNKGGTLYNIALLACISDSRDYSIPEDYSVAKSPKIAQKNMAFIKGRCDYNRYAMILNNRTSDTLYYKIEMSTENSFSRLFNYHVQLYLSKELATQWKKNGMVGENISTYMPLFPRSIIYKSSGASITVPLVPNSSEKVLLSIERLRILVADSTLKNEKLRVKIYEESKLIAGHTLMVSSDTTNAVELKFDIETGFTPGGKYALRANTSATDENIVWYNESGENIGFGSTVVFPLTMTNSMVEAIAFDDDGECQYGQTTLTADAIVESVVISDGQIIVTLANPYGQDVLIVVDEVQSQTGFHREALIPAGSISMSISVPGNRGALYDVDVKIGSQTIKSMKLTF